MNIKRMFLGVVLVGGLLVGAASASAQRRSPAIGERGLIASAIAAAVEQSGLERAAIVEQLQAGRTLAEIVTEAGGDIQAVIDAAVAVGQARINEALANGRITEEQAAALAAELTNGVTSAVNGETPARWVGRGAVRMSASRILLQAMTDATGLSRREIMRQWRGGATLGAIAQAHGSSAGAVVEAALADATERVNTAVASGAMMQAQADILLNELPNRFSEVMGADV